MDSRSEIIATTTFDYSSLSPDRSRDLQAAVARIQHLDRRLTRTALEIGKELNAVKAKLEHGAFGKWLELEFCWSDRTARNYMRLAEWAADKPETIADLPPSIVYLLASPSTPETISTQVIARIGAGERPNEQEIKSAISTARFQEKKAFLEKEAEHERHRRERHLSARQRKRRADRKTEIERQQSEEAQRRTDAEARAEAVVDYLKSKLADDYTKLVTLIHEGRDHWAFTTYLLDRLSGKTKP